MTDVPVFVGQTDYHFVATIYRKDGATAQPLTGATIRCLYRVDLETEKEVPGAILTTDPETGVPLQVNQVAWRHPPEGPSIFAAPGDYLFRFAITDADGVTFTEPFRVVVR